MLIEVLVVIAIMVTMAAVVVFVVIPLYKDS